MTNIFLDGGTHLGGGIKAISKKEKIDKTWKIYSWEANPYTYKRNLNNIKKYNHLDVTFFNSALSTYNGTVDVQIQEQKEKHTNNLVNTGQGTTILPIDNFNFEVKEKKILETININCIDFVEWITKNTEKDDNIIIKLDIEGAEYDLLDHLIKSDILHRIKKMYIEWHAYAMKNKAELDIRQQKIESILLEKNIKLISWI